MATITVRDNSPVMGRSFLSRQLSNVTSFAKRKLTADNQPVTNVFVPGGPTMEPEKSKVPLYVGAGAAVLLVLAVLTKKRR